MDGLSVSSYLAYKQDTSAFVSWLGIASKLCGWKQPRRAKSAASEVKTTVVALPQDNKASGRLKGKARKEAKDAAASQPKATQGRTGPALSNAQIVLPKRLFTTAELIQQIELVSQTDAARVPEVKMPAYVYKALRRAITARERFSRWHRRAGVSSIASTESHVYFASILSRALVLIPGVDHNGGLSTVRPSDEGSSDVNFMVNMFALLHVEETPEEPDDQAVFDHQPAKISNAVQYGTEEDESMTEIDFAIFSIFEDVHRLRAETQRNWERLRDGDMSLVQATLSLAAAIDLVRRAEEEVMQVVASHSTPEYFDSAFSTGSYQFFVGKIYNSRALGREKGYSVNDEEHAISITPFDEFVLLPLGHSLLKCGFFWAEKRRGHSAPMMPLPPLRMDYKGATNLLDVPQYQNYEIEDQVLVQLCHEMRFIEEIRNGKFLRHDSPEDDELVKESVLPFDDIFHSAIRPIWDQGQIGMQAAFAARAMVDMYKICGPCLDGNRLLSEQTKPYLERFGFGSTDDVGEMLGLQGLVIPRLTDTRRLLATLWQRSTNGLTQDAFWLRERGRVGEIIQMTRMQMTGGKGKGKGSEEPLTLEHKTSASHPLDDEQPHTFTGIWHHESPNFYGDANLLYGGTALLEVAAMTERTGIAVANESMSIFCMAHIYNAATKLCGLDIHWPELDRVIELHAAALFANDIPSVPRVIHERFKYRVGLGSRSNFSRTFAASFSSINGKALQAQGLWMLQPTPLSITIQEFLDTKTSPRALSRLIYQLEQQTSPASKSTSQQQHRNFQAPATPSVSVSNPNDGTNQRQMTFRQTLQHLERHIDAILPDIQLDYIALTRTCNGLLQTLRAEVQARFEVDYDIKDSQTRNSDDIGDAFRRVETTAYILEENAETATLSEVMKRKKYRNLDIPKISPIGQQLEYVAQFLRLHLTQKHDNSNKETDGNATT